MLFRSLNDVIDPNCPIPIDNIIQKACMKDPMDRYASVDLMKKDIERLSKNPSLLEEKPRSFLYNLFHRDSPSAQERRREKEKKKALKEAAKRAKKEEER